MKLGPTGKFPRGSPGFSDEGELTMAVWIYKGQVRVDFGNPVTWFALPPNEAKALGQLLIEKANGVKQ